MTNGLKNQSIDEAKGARDAWVSENISNFRNMGYSEKERYNFLGYAIHAMSDQNAPTHNWKPWYGQPWYSCSAVAHFIGELNPFGSFSKAYNLSEIMVRETYHEAKSTQSPDPTPPPQPVPVPPPTTVTPPSPPPGLIPPTPQPEPPVIINPPLIIPRPIG